MMRIIKILCLSDKVEVTSDGWKLYSLHFKFRHSSAIDNLKIIGQQGT